VSLFGFQFQRIIDVGFTSQADAVLLKGRPAGAGHFVKMVYNGIEYALMAYAEGFDILAHANAGKRAQSPRAVRQATADWQYSVVSIGYPGPVLHEKPVTGVPSE
jgi:6-phosphogluconate dehydrogenase (decarboxylating)